MSIIKDRTNEYFVIFLRKALNAGLKSFKDYFNPWFIACLGIIASAFLFVGLNQGYKSPDVLNGDLVNEDIEKKIRDSQDQKPSMIFIKFIEKSYPILFIIIAAFILFALWNKKKRKLYEI